MCGLRVFLSSHLIFTVSFSYFKFNGILSAAVFGAGDNSNANYNTLCQSRRHVSFNNKLCLLFLLFRKRIGLNFGKCFDFGVRNTFHLFGLRCLGWSYLCIVLNYLPIVFNENWTSKTTISSSKFDIHHSFACSLSLELKIFLMSSFSEPKESAVENPAGVVCAKDGPESI